MDKRKVTISWGDEGEAPEEYEMIYVEEVGSWGGYMVGTPNAEQEVWYTPALADGTPSGYAGSAGPADYDVLGPEEAALYREADAKVRSAFA